MRALALVAGSCSLLLHQDTTGHLNAVYEYAEPRTVQVRDSRARSHGPIPNLVTTRVIMRTAINPELYNKYSGYRTERLINIGYDVIAMLNTDRQSN